MGNVIKSASRGDCDRCGANVQAHDDCTYLEEARFALLNGKRPFCGFTKGRHIACSPSRAQALVGDDATWLAARDLLVSAAMDLNPEMEMYDDAINRHLALTAPRCTTPPTNPPKTEQPGD